MSGNEPRLSRSILAVVNGTVAGQAIAFAFSPLITRIFGPEAFGVQGLFIGLISILMPAAALRYPFAIVVAKTPGETQALARLSLTIAGAFAVATALFLLGFRDWLLPLMGMERLGSLVWFLPLALFLAAVQDVVDQQCIRANGFRVIGVVTALQALLVNLARVLGGLVQPVAAVLVSVTSVSYGVQALLLGLLKPRTAHAAPRVALLTVMRKYKEFPLYSMPADLASALSQTAPVFLLAMLFSPAAAGLYTLARSVVNLPLNVIGLAVGKVLYARMAEMASRGQPLLPFVLRMTMLQLLGPGMVTAAVTFTFPVLFALIFGESWRTAGEFAQWMSLWVVCMLANIPSVRALTVIRRQCLHLLFNLLLLSGGILGIWLGHWLHGTETGAVATYSVIIAALYSLQILVYLDQVRRFDRRNSRHG